jgi:hypothetical protein
MRPDPKLEPESVVKTPDPDLAKKDPDPPD